MVGKYLNFRTDKLLRLACIRHRIFSQEETRIHCQRFQRIFRVSKTIEGSTIGSSNFRTNAVLLKLRVIISQTNGFILTVIIMVDPVHSISKWSDQHITILGTSPRTTDMYLSKSIHRSGIGNHPLLGEGVQSGEGFTMPYGHDGPINTRPSPSEPIRGST